MDSSNENDKSRFPPWLKKRLPAGGAIEEVRVMLREMKLATVCQSARCPNLCECFARGTATFMILGNVCARNCGFCAVQHGAAKALDPEEPERVATAAARLRLTHVVVTSVTRDDLPDGGAEHFAQTIRALHKKMKCRVEVLTPDFQGSLDAIRTVADAGPEVYNHNVETVPRLYPTVRPQADYRRSLDLLSWVKTCRPGLTTKSGLMVGLGETREEVSTVLRDLRAVGCDLLTVGQYLAPSRAHLPVKEFVRPEEFDWYDAQARGIGFLGVAAGPFVRSSYRAGALFQAATDPDAPADGDLPQP